MSKTQESKQESEQESEQESKQETQESKQETQPEVVETVMARRITLAVLNGIRGGFRDVKGKVHVGRIYGSARTVTAKVSENMGTSYCFGGEFKGILGTRVLVGGQAYFPEPVQSVLRGAVEALEGKGSVDFGFDFFVVEDGKSPMGYVFESKSIFEVQTSDALKVLEKRMNQKLLA